MSPAGTRQQITENVPTNRTKTMPEQQQTRETRTPANLSTKYDPKLGETNAKRFQAGVIALLKTSDHKGERNRPWQKSRVVSALCTTSKPYVLVRRVSDDKATSRVPPGTPRDEEIRGWSLQARLRAREGGLKSLEVLWVLGVDPAAGGCRTGPPNRWIWSADLPNEMGSKSTRRGVPFHFFLPSNRADPARSIAVRISEGTPLGHEGHFWPPPCRGAANVRAGTGPGPRFGHRVPKSVPTGWAIPPDPQQPRGGEIPVQGGP